MQRQRRRADGIDPPRAQAVHQQLRVTNRTEHADRAAYHREQHAFGEK
jgi:hypothetical protein